MLRRSLLAAAFSLTAMVAVSQPATAEKQTAIFAGGCFWCVEADFDKVPGVLDTVSGYAGGSTENPTYRTYSSGGHREVVKIDFDDAKVSYDRLLEIFFRSVDPTDAGGQFCDRGESYSTAVYALDDAQKAAADKAKQEANAALGGKVVTPVLGPAKFWPAEDYHQNYYQSDERILSRFGLVKKKDAYKGYRKGCGRDARVRQVWGEAAFTGIK
ncbi:peptide-methionine (S)-S-oxide reductase MsrA [Nitratireductor rhodophyticola]|uniref:Peptide methionine sulfoxide reductase MsrA n=1 Tax=Nitratireductor rhodophyticola TaxID=2854036 RepID=A0ABS7R5S7_9HYPH|nr:peptide-methionine (S)-S-oxide reductase MsrA [Nitratireductor rhodophyticola]MBY8916273.1 peptide-methionine (S)-S-oxide reductase MsrA [Nitratireductor rhodophyticola]MBY8921636.1 peptide-methionine (S)-S-oxide reductase MsrA [Nitratireductor rhodophyticola]MEC9245590.1 peptide-methionine (S)-S-oxide reductase MsrA [Pseudomonadota bacterium]WPZ15598.1 peptide-methionine (S)-S-oxide reductase MsrA [Nitratireductor rhodophyticola]